MAEAAVPPVLCFGEVLWDCLPRGLFPGGAPINVAYHLQKLGMTAFPVTAVGKDFLGQELIRRLEQWGLDTRFVNILPEKQTGVVRAHIQPD
ncbi:MAG TPA: PfkB family carbohydrate kinase, partial [Terrimicrobiaceae bacterium]